MKDYLRENVCFAVSIGSLRAVSGDIKHQGRQKGTCEKLASLIDSVGYKLQRLNEEEVEILSECIRVSSKLTDSIVENPYNNLLNLTAFCMEEIKHLLTTKHFKILDKVFSVFDGSDCYTDIRIGERIFTRLLTELEISTA